MLTIDYKDYITLEDNHIALSFNELHIDPSNYPSEFQVKNYLGDVYGEFKLSEVQKDSVGQIYNVKYIGSFVNRGKWTATIYNVEYSSIQDEEENKMMEF